MRFANEFGACEIHTLPGSPQVAVSHAVFVYPSQRGKGKGALNHTLRLDRLRKLGYNYVLATVVVGNAAEEAILRRNAWKRLDSFTSDATGREIALWGRPL